MRCECELPGTLRSGIKGVLACPAGESGKIGIERCDACERFHSDEAAAVYFATSRGGSLRYTARQRRILWLPR